MISVVVPSRDRPVELERCVGALKRQSVEVEVLVVDDRSRDRAAVRRATGDATLVIGSGAGPAAARNAGIEAASGSIVCLLDDDCEPVPRWAELLAEGCRATGVAAGRTIPTASAPACARASQAIANGLMRDRAHGDGHRTSFAPSCNLALDAALAVELRFDERFPAAAGEDREWSARAAAGGHAPFVVDGAVVVHHQRMTAAGFARQQFGYGRGAARFRAVSEAPGDGDRLLPLRLTRWAFAEGVSVGAWVGAAQFATAAGFLTETLSRRREPARAPAPS